MDKSPIGQEFPCASVTLDKSPFGYLSLWTIAGGKQSDQIKFVEPHPSKISLAPPPKCFLSSPFQNVISPQKNVFFIHFHFEYRYAVVPDKRIGVYYLLQSPF